MLSGKLLAWVLYGLGAVLCGFALRTLGKPGRLRALAWSTGWCGLATAGTLCFLVGADCGRYRTLLPGVVIATVTLSRQAAIAAGAAGYRARIQTPDGTVREADFTGDHWIFDAQTIRCILPSCPLYLYRGRHFYAAREQPPGRLPEYDTVALDSAEAPVDVWHLIQRIPGLRGVLVAGDTATPAIAARDGASYEIRFDGQGRLSASDTGW